MDGDFNAWFIAQHGPRPGGMVGDDALQDRAKVGKAAEAMIALRVEWDVRRQSALYAWAARDGLARVKKGNKDG